MRLSELSGDPARSTRLPLAVEEITPAWLTGMLGQRFPGAEISEIRTLETISGHTTKLRLALERNAVAVRAGIPAQVCLKANLTGDPLSSQVCANEARFFHLLRGKLSLPAPRCHMADWDDDEQGSQGLILLEDLVPQGGRFGVSGLAIDVDDMASSLEQLAELHAATWDLAELHHHCWLETAMAPETVTDDYWTLMGSHTDLHNAREDHLGILPAWAAQEPQRMHEAFLQLRQTEMDHAGPLCLVHGDAHAGNTWQRPDGKRIWIDWQIVRKGRPFRDVTYFLVGSLSIEDRRRCERDLVRHYCEAMARHGIRLDSEAAWRDYRRWVVWGLIAWHLNINPNEPTLPTLEKFARAADDLAITEFYRF